MQNFRHREQNDLLEKRESSTAWFPTQAPETFSKRHLAHLRFTRNLRARRLPFLELAWEELTSRFFECPSAALSKCGLDARVGQNKRPDSPVWSIFLFFDTLPVRTPRQARPLQRTSTRELLRTSRRENSRTSTRETRAYGRLASRLSAVVNWR